MKAERKFRLPTKGSSSDSQCISLQKPCKSQEIGGQYSTSLKKITFNLDFSYPAKLSFTTEGKIKSFMNKQELRDFITTRPALQELLKEALHTERNNQY